MNGIVISGTGDTTSRDNSINIRIFNFKVFYSTAKVANKTTPNSVPRLYRAIQPGNGVASPIKGSFVAIGIPWIIDSSNRFPDTQAFGIFIPAFPTGSIVKGNVCRQLGTSFEILRGTIGELTVGKSGKPCQLLGGADLIRRLRRAVTDGRFFHIGTPIGVRRQHRGKALSFATLIGHPNDDIRSRSRKRNPTEGELGNVVAHLYLGDLQIIGLKFPIDLRHVGCLEVGGCGIHHRRIVKAYGQHTGGIGICLAAVKETAKGQGGVIKGVKGSQPKGVNIKGAAVYLTILVLEGKGVVHIPRKITDLFEINRQLSFTQGSAFQSKLFGFAAVGGNRCMEILQGNHVRRESSIHRRCKLTVFNGKIFHHEGGYIKLSRFCFAVLIF